MGQIDRSIIFSSYVKVPLTLLIWNLLHKKILFHFCLFNLSLWLWQWLFLFFNESASNQLSAYSRIKPHSPAFFCSFFLSTKWQSKLLPPSWLYGSLLERLIWLWNFASLYPFLFEISRFFAGRNSPPVENIYSQNCSSLLK